MPYLARFTVLVFCVGFTCCLGVAAAAADRPAPPTTKSPTAKIETYVGADDEGYFAFNLWPAVAQPPASPLQLTVIFDTSASQTGSFRQQGLAALETLLAEQSSESRVALVAADVQAVPLTSGFVPASSDEMQQALEQLRQRVPLGATDMGGAIEAAVRLQSQTELAGGLRRIAYIGDGVSSAGLISPARMRQLADRCVALRMSVSSYAVGPQLDLPLLGALAKHTGGMVVLDADEQGTRRPGAELAEAVRGAVLWPDAIALPAGLRSAYFRDVPPLRFDRDTVVIGSFSASQWQADKPQTIDVTAKLSGKPVELHFNAQASGPSDDNAYLAELVTLAERDGGASLPTVDSAGLAELRKLVNSQARSLSRLSQQALAMGDLSQAKRLADRASKIDPADPETAIVLTTLRKAGNTVDGQGPQ
ncbi:MAG TPA: hypothetical protein VHB99_20010, partial [Pirellulales bacterium]|nr:hypothetical protein [Pirellulales bacterium]